MPILTTQQNLLQRHHVSDHPGWRIHCPGCGMMILARTKEALLANQQDHAAYVIREEDEEIRSFLTATARHKEPR